MISRITSQWRGLARQFAREEDGATNVVAMVIMVPVLFLILATALEVGLFTARAAMLERGVDMATRQLRIDTGAAPQHDELKTIICDRAAIIPNCETNLKLEMINRDLRAWEDIPSKADCTDRALEVAPVRSFVPGLDNELMVLRACAKLEPVFGTTWLTLALHTDHAGDYGVVSTSAFVQEPR